MNREGYKRTTLIKVDLGKNTNLSGLFGQWSNMSYRRKQYFLTVDMCKYKITENRMDGTRQTMDSISELLMYLRISIGDLGEQDHSDFISRVDVVVT